ncbi:dynein regulatory complex subunit 3 [Myripristis murdjan]|uniref:dynein regulatory complex subunit 3 n=1 Tax=Myripristis murdjan TaxID=586833 RepID=UPI0011760F5C|nr:dynein regulatory complex subunit 3 [Myripristis murdjan]
MIRHYGEGEPHVMDEGMLQKALEGQTGYVSKQVDIQFSEVLQLQLAYKGIRNIEYLWQFTSLTKLELNNNIIKKIKGLDRLTNLTWLNLSFNNIEKIEGLETLVKLELLNLSNNRISVLENMDALENLNVFSIADNLLGELENVIYLRKFTQLHTLNLYGNPISEDENYKLFITAYFPDLMYLDYRSLDEETKNQALTKYFYDIEKIRRHELQLQQAVEANKRQEAELQLHRDAFVEFLNGSYLFDSMFKGNPEAEKLHCLTGVADLLQTFESQMVELCAQVFEIGLAEHKLREAEVQLFLSGHTEAVADNQQRAAQMVANFEEHHGETIAGLQQMSDTNQLEVKLSHCRDEINQLSDSLMKLEIQLVNQLEDMMKDFELKISDMVTNFIETVQGIFAQCRDLENFHHEKLKEIAVATLEKVAKSEVEEDIPDNVRMFFLDKDQVMNALGASHDTHLVKINDRENLLGTRVNAWKVALLKEYQDKEMKRNRMRISEIHSLADCFRKQLERLQLHGQ